MCAAVVDIDPRRHARALFWQGWSVARIAEYLDLKAATIHSWKYRDKWEESTPIERAAESTEIRYIQLINKDEKEAKDFKEIDLLGRQLERMARIGKYSETGRESDLNPNIEKRNAGPKKPPRRNVIEGEDAEKLQQAFLDSLFDYQHIWYDAGLVNRIRDILKSRQIGATWYFAREAIADAVANANNQIFLSASKAQAHVFKQYIIQFVRDAIGIELRGDPIVLGNGAELHFLGTNSRTAQSYHGNLYVDEYFWIPRFLELRKVASGMAMHKRWRQTYFSAPSAITHEAYSWWNGDLFNKGRLRDQRVQIDITHEALKGGLKCADGKWRQIVTVLDALAGGCDLFDLDQLRMEYGPHEFENLLMCQFIDDTMSIFPLVELQACMVDSWVVWDDFKPFAQRPFAYQPVWLGYDPALSGDSAGLVVLAPPAKPGGKFRVLEKHQFKGMDFAAQAAAIKKLTECYNVTYIGIDVTGIGHGVHELVKGFFPVVQAFSYSPEVKSRLVLKAKDVISNGRLEFDAGWTDLAQAFMAIRKTLTASGRHITYEAGRSNDIGHADLAWACMHAMANEPLAANSGSGKGIMEIC